MNECRFCDHPLNYTFIDLQHSPVSNAFLAKEKLSLPETTFPLIVKVCENCFLVQTQDYQSSSDLFTNDYPYFSSFSKSWLTHSKEYVEMMMKRFKFRSDALIVEIASNDGYLLQYFKDYDVNVCGIEPARSTAEVAVAKGIDTIIDFFGIELAKEKFNEKKADLIIGNNVLAHVPNINDFVSGVKESLSDNGICTFEFPHLVELVANNQFDTIYHEHFSYLSLYSVSKIFEKHGLEIFDVEKLKTHGGSLRVFVRNYKDGSHPVTSDVKSLLNEEIGLGINKLDYYHGLEKKAMAIKLQFLQFLINAKSEGKEVIAYGAAAKGNTFLNYCGIKNDLIDFCCDANVHKQGMLMPGSHIPIESLEKIKSKKPDYIVILPWNLKHEIVKDLSYIKDWGGHFVMAIPELTII
ncbi:class I SAM-dependent methyltransferase [Fulvivirga lutimaris]|uniref:class I SAM-dependent methyltransferase n=1 Tax=Fulvivirga lutimaris TaxID=1819566 RepID=UPI0012BCBA94|nr:class I SAM-dependent methyltransferase [Fulvivirga lutimaris]MTI38245.1 class I SAM-dependent methyltransferase [Fulvivirga lutimaris]